MSEPEDGMGGKHLIDLGTGSDTNSAYASITLLGCSVEGAGAKGNTITAGTGAVAIYRNDDLTTDPAAQRNDVSTCDAAASFRWIHAARLLICQCEAGTARQDAKKERHQKEPEMVTGLRFCVFRRYYSYFHRNSTVCGDARAPVLPSSGISCQCDFGISSTSYLSWMIGPRTARIDALFAQKSHQEGKWQ